MTFESLLNNARQRLATTGASRTRVTVQVGQCSQAVGADAVADALGEALACRDDCYLVLSGCDGACFAAPQVVVQESGGAIRYYSRVAASDVPAIAADIGAGHGQRPSAELESFFTPQHLQVMAWCGNLDPADVYDYVAVGGYASLADALSRPPRKSLTRCWNRVCRAGAGPTSRRPASGRALALFPNLASWWSTPRKANPASSRTATLWRDCLTA